MKAVIWALLLVAGCAIADDVYVFPAEGQTKEQQEKDKFECYQWAAEQAGFDPVAASGETPGTDVSAESDSNTGGAGKAVLGGATKGAIIAEVSDGDAGKGAATGATMGVFKGKRQRQAAAEQQKAAEEKARAEALAKERELRANYARANAACLEGRGYTVK